MGSEFSEDKEQQAVENEEDVDLFDSRRLERDQTFPGVKPQPYEHQHENC